MQVHPNNPDEVLWLQQSLLRVVPGYIYVVPSGQYDALTRKEVGNFQRQNDLPVTGEPDEATTTKIEQELAVLDSQPFKKKQKPLPPMKNPGDPVVP